MILFISDFGGSLPIVYKMRQEGTDVRIYIHNSRYKNSYDGIIEKVDLKGLKTTMIDAEKIIYDSNVQLGRLNDNMEFKTINRPLLFGKTQDKEIAEEAGIKVSKKPVSGIQLITEMWFNGKEPTFFTHSLPNRHWLTGDLGLEMGSQSNCLWVTGESGPLVDSLKSLVPILTSSGYVGAVSVDCTLNSKDKKPYFNSWHFGFQYDSIFCLLSLLGSSVTEFFTKAYMVQDNGFACSERVTIAPYPYTNEELLSGMARDKRLNFDLNDMNGFWGQDIKSDDGEVACAGNDGVIGVMTAVGKKIEDGFGKIYKSIRKLDIEVPLQFRIDGAKESNKKLKKLNDWNICVN